ncbi:MAG TPA: glycosyltransferase family 39 protein [Acidobacteriaceae bacterium]|jgi:hypothetical protein
MTGSPPLHVSSVSSVSSRERQIAVVLWVCGAVLIGCAAVFVVMTRHWPMVGDAALLHYVVFLIEHGWAPYRDFADVNMPGAYAVTALGMLLPGQPDAAWRVFDLALVALAGVGYYAIARPYSRFAALFATVLLLLVHGQDGVQQAGQRDLVIAALLLLGVASLVEGLRREQWAYVVPFGLLVGMAATIKPTALPFGVVLLAMAALYRRRCWPGASTRPVATVGWIVTGLAAMVCAPVAMLLWLSGRYHALDAWIAMQRVLLPYYATLERRPFGFTLTHSISPLLALVLLWLACLAARSLGRNAESVRQGWPRFERLLIAAAAVMNLIGLLAQGKALPYQRYPMLAFLLLLISLDLATTLRAGRAGYWAMAGLACGALVLAPQALVRVHRFDPRPQEFDAMLASDLQRLGGSRLSGRVQCLDTIQDCLPTLFSERLLPATGTLSDTAIFSPSESPAVRYVRRQFAQALNTHPPAVIVLVSGSFLDSTGGFTKVDAWPEFAAWLGAHYTLTVERTPPHMVRWWSRPQPAPSYRLYLRNATAGVTNALPH